MRASLRTSVRMNFMNRLIAAKKLKLLLKLVFFAKIRCNIYIYYDYQALPSKQANLVTV